MVAYGLDEQKRVKCERTDKLKFRWPTCGCERNIKASDTRGYGEGKEMATVAHGFKMIRWAKHLDKNCKYHSQRKTPYPKELDTYNEQLQRICEKRHWEPKYEKTTVVVTSDPDRKPYRGGPPPQSKERFLTKHEAKRQGYVTESAAINGLSERLANGVQLSDQNRRRSSKIPVK